LDDTSLRVVAAEEEIIYRGKKEGKGALPSFT
jgi:hypothetical protein